MKVLGMDKDGKPEWIEQHSIDVHVDEAKILMKRLKHPFYDWLWAREAGDKYRGIANQDLEHFLVALDDLLTFIKSQDLCGHEKNELNNFLKSLQG